MTILFFVFSLALARESKRDLISERLGTPALRAAYPGRDGYLRFAELFFNSNLQACYTTVAGVLTKAERESLGWGSIYFGTIHAHHAERTRLFDGRQPRAEYVGPHGYAAYATLYYSGNMGRAFQNVASALTHHEFTKLGWRRAFLDSDEEREKMRTFLFQDGIWRWRGKKLGLSAVVHAYLASKGNPTPTAKEQNRVRQLFRAAVTDGEMNALFWDSVTMPPCSGESLEL